MLIVANRFAVSLKAGLLQRRAEGMDEEGGGEGEGTKA